MEYLYGLLNLDFWGYVLVTFIMVQITMMAVTLYLHRDQAHRSFDFDRPCRQLRSGAGSSSGTPAAEAPAAWSPTFT